MREVQFVHERPQKRGQSARKRSRLVTSCDACRARKVKCTPSENGDPTCKACTASGSDCVYTERDRIRAERGIVDLSASRVKARSRLALPGSRPPPRGYASFEAGSSKQVDSSNLYVPTNVTFPLPFSNLSDGVSVPWSVPFALFDHHRPDYPNSSLMHHFITIFEAYGQSLFPFFSAEDLISKAVAETLPPLTANCIAAFAARYSNRIHHAPGAQHLSGERYLQTAKTLLAPLINMNMPSLDILHAIIIIAWVECGSGRPSGLWTFGRTATLMANNLNIDREEHIMKIPDEATRDLLRSTFWAVAWLDILSSSVARVPSHLRLPHSTTAAPFMSRYVPSADALNRRTMYSYLKRLLSMMGFLSQVSMKAPIQTTSAARDAETVHFRQLMSSIQDGLPEDLHATPHNIKTAYAHGCVHDFCLLHLLIHTMTIVAYCPSLFWKTQISGNRIAYDLALVGWSSARAIVDVTLMLQNVDERRIVSVPSYFMSLSIASGALLLRTSDTVNSSSSQHIHDQAIETNMWYLVEARKLMARLGTVWTNTVEEIGFQASIMPKAESSSTMLRFTPYDVHPTPAPTFLQPAFSPESMIVTNNYPLEPQPQPQDPNPNHFYYHSNQLPVPVDHTGMPTHTHQGYVLPLAVGDQVQIQDTGVPLETHAHAGGYYDPHASASSSVNMKGAAAASAAYTSLSVSQASQRSSEWSVSPPSSVHLTEHSVATTPQWNMNAVPPMQHLAEGENIIGDRASLGIS